MSKRKLLLADDSITIQKVVNLTFADEGIEVIAVGDGDSAMEKINESLPDLILADVNMPGLSGYEICEQIKQNPETKSIPVILLVGSFEPFDEEKARQLGADAFLTKPFQSIRQLVNKVTELLEAKDEKIETETPVETDADTNTDWQYADTKELPKEEINLPEYGDAGFDDEMIDTERFDLAPADEPQPFDALEVPQSFATEPEEIEETEPEEAKEPAQFVEDEVKETDFEIVSDDPEEFEHQSEAAALAEDEIAENDFAEPAETNSEDDGETLYETPEIVESTPVSENVYEFSAGESELKDSPETEEISDEENDDEEISEENLETEEPESAESEPEEMPETTETANYSEEKSEPIEAESSEIEPEETEADETESYKNEVDEADEEISDETKVEESDIEESSVIESSDETVESDDADNIELEAADETEKSEYSDEKSNVDETIDKPEETPVTATAADEEDSTAEQVSETPEIGEDSPPASESEMDIDDMNLLEIPAFKKSVSAMPSFTEAKPFVSETKAEMPEIKEEVPEIPTVETVPAEVKAEEKPSGMINLSSLSPELIDAIAQKIADKISEKEIKDIVWEVVPQMTELIIKKMAEEKEKE